MCRSHFIYCFNKLITYTVGIIIKLGQLLRVGSFCDIIFDVYGNIMYCKTSRLESYIICLIILRVYLAGGQIAMGW